MKKRIVFISMCLVGIWMVLPSVNATEVIKGNKKLITKDITVQDFERVTVQGNGNGGNQTSFFRRTKGNYEFEYSQVADSPGLTITMDENLFDYLTIEEVGEKLILKLGNDEIKLKPSKIKIKGTSSQLKEVRLKNMAMNFNSPESLQSDTLELYLEGIGDFNLDNLTCTRLTGRIEGIGDINVVGTVYDSDISISGIGNLDGTKCQFHTMRCDVSGIGKMNFNVSERLYARLSGIGRIRYAGNPTCDLQSDGIGRIKRIK